MTEPKDDLDLVREMLDKGEFEDVREMARIWRGLKAMGYLGSFLLRVFALVGGLYGSWYAFEHWLLAFMRGGQ